MRYHTPRRGFTLIEIMVVIVIISILAAILVPVLGNITRRARETAVKVEITSLENAIADFRTRFGVEPPSHIHVYEKAAQWNSNPADRGTITRIWPRFLFAKNRDLDLDGSAGEADPDSDNEAGIHLSGSECLVFFLGGMTAFDQAGKPYMTGFSRNPADPLQRPLVVGESRDGPFYEFETARLVDIDNYPTTGSTSGGDRFPEYIDTLSNQTAPYLYLSSYGGRGYLPDDCWVYNPHASNNPHNPTTGGYLQNANAFWRAKSFQIISPGSGPHENNLGVYKPYGTGGLYNPESAELLTPQDGDNITNFAPSGRLKP